MRAATRLVCDTFNLCTVYKKPMILVGKQTGQSTNTTFWLSTIIKTFWEILIVQQVPENSLAPRAL